MVPPHVGESKPLSQKDFTLAVLALAERAFTLAKLHPLCLTELTCGLPF